MSHSFTYKSIDFSGENYRVYVVGPVHQRMPEPRVNIHQFAQADGGVSQGASFGMRRIMLDVKLAASGATNRATQMENVIAALRLSQTEGPGDLSIDMFPGKLYTNAKLTSDVSASVSANMEEFRIEFVCDPWPMATEVESVTSAATTNGVTYSLNPGGQIKTHATYTVKNTSGSAAAGVALANSTSTGSAIWSNSLANGDWLRLSSETQAAEVSDDDGDTWTAVPANLTGTIPQIKGGVENGITITGLDSTLDVEYTPGYVA